MEVSKPLVLVSDDPLQREEMVRQLIRIGYDVVDGYLGGGMDAWESAGLPQANVRLVTPQEVYAEMESGHGPMPIDVRFGYEWRTGHVPDARHIALGDLPTGVRELSKEGAYAAFCAAGVRAATAASVMEREGIDDVSLVVGGTSAWQAAGYPLDMD